MKTDEKNDMKRGELGDDMLERVSGGAGTDASELVAPTLGGNERYSVKPGAGTISVEINASSGQSELTVPENAQVSITIPKDTTLKIH